jgi:rhamnogalacturonan endolyase
MKTTYKLIIYFVLIIEIISSCTRQNPAKNRLFTEDFHGALNTKKWIAEIEPLPNSRVFTQDNKLVLDTKGGVTVWYNQVLTGNYEILFKRKVIVAAGKNDRLSDLNVFWLAQSPNNTNVFTRTGKFEDYDSLNMYYVGMGGNTNTTTRFRKYEANAQRKLLAEKNEAKYLLKPNHEYQIKIVVKDNVTSFWVDGEMLFQVIDEHFPSQSYFGFRSTYSHQEIWDFKVLSI